MGQSWSNGVCVKFDPSRRRPKEEADDRGIAPECERKSSEEKGQIEKGCNLRLRGNESVKTPKEMEVCYLLFFN